MHKSKGKYGDFNESNQYYCSVDNVVFNKDKTQLVYYPLGKEDKEYTVPEGTKQVLTWAFPDGGTEYYPPIRVLNLPASLEPSKSLYDGSWVYPSFDLFLVESINMDSQNPSMCSEGGILINTDKTQLID